MTLTTAAVPSESVPKSSPAAGQRLMSVDALRGFDMFWIIGADSLVYALHRMTRNPCTSFLADQLEHAEWAGFHFYDLIFPLFVFLAGVSLVFSLTRTTQEFGRGEALKRVARRGLLLFVIGILYSGGFSRGWPDMRLMGVLNRIALAYTFAGFFFCFLKPRGLAAITATLLIGYWALLTFVPIRDIQLTRSHIARLAADSGDATTAAYFANENSPNPSAVKASPAWSATRTLFYATTNQTSGKYGPGYNLADHTDFQYLPGKKYDTFYDPEGLLSTIPAIATCLLGAFAGLLLRETRVLPQRKVFFLMGLGCLGILAGWLWNLQFPVIKKIWTSSYVLVAAGYSALLLAAFYQIVDVWQKRRWCEPFVWMGMNSITIYLVKNVIGGGFSRVSERFVGGDIKVFFDTRIAKGFGDLMVSMVGLLLAFWFVHFMYRRKLFLRF